MYDLADTRVGIDSDEDSLGIYRRRLRDGKAARTQLPGERWLYEASPDGRFLAAVEIEDSATTLFVAKSEDLASMRQIVSTPESISSVLWGGDGALLYFVAPRGEGDRTDKERLYSIRSDGSEGRLVATFDFAEGSYRYRTLLAHNQRRNEVVWFNQVREGAGGSEGLFATNVDTGKTRSLGLPSTLLAYHASAITSDGEKFYYVQDRTHLIERTVFTRAERVLYRADGRKEVAVEHLEVTPDGSILVFQATQDPFLGPSSNEDRPLTTTYRLRPSDLRRTAINVERRANSHMTSDGVSPDGRYVWLRHADISGNVILLDIETRRRQTVAAGASTRTAFLLGWLSLPA